MVTRRDNPFWRTKHESILEAAIGEFSAKGFELASMERISEVAGVSKVTVYNHFSTKEKLFVSCIHHFFDFQLKPFTLPQDEQLQSQGERVSACVAALVDYCLLAAHAAMANLLRTERYRCLTLGVKYGEADLFPVSVVETLSRALSGDRKRSFALAEMIHALVLWLCLGQVGHGKSEADRGAQIKQRIIAVLQDAGVLTSES